MTGSQCAGGIGQTGISHEVKRLAATASKIYGPAVTSAARVRQPFFPPKSVESRGTAPDVREPVLRDPFELQPWNRMCQMAGQRESLRVDHDEPASPSFHAGLWVFRIIVWRDEDDLHSSTQARFRLSCNGSCPLDVLPSGQECIAIL